MGTRYAVLIALTALELTGSARAEAQSPLFLGAIEHTPTFVGDDFDGIDGSLGFAGGMLFPVGSRTHLGAQIAWSGVDLKGSVGGGDDTNLLDLAAVVRVRATPGEDTGGYLDLRAGYSRLAFVVSPYDDAVSGLMLGAGLGALVSTEGFQLDLYARFQHQRFGDDGVEGLLWEGDASGGRLILGAGIAVSLGR